MPTGSLARMPAERRRQLVRTAAQEFAVGYEQASLNRIIAACGLSKSSFYHVIASKQELFGLVVDDLAGELAQLIDVPEPAEFGGGRFWPRTERLFEQFLRAAGRDEAYVALGRMFYLAGTPDEAQHAVSRALTAVQDWLEQTLLVGRTDGTVRDDLPTALQVRLLLAVLRAFDAWSLEHHDDLPPDEMSRLAEIQLAAVHRLIATD